MEKIKTLTVNGESYQIWDAEAAHINDSKISADTCWSSHNLIRQLCPAFVQGGSVVTCQPVEHSPLQVVSHIDPIQAGSGDASPDNIRPISGHSSVTLIRNDEEFTLDLGREVYGGSFNWATGELVINWAKTVFNGTESWVFATVSVFLYTSCFQSNISQKAAGYSNIMCNAFTNTNNSNAFTPNVAKSGMFTGHPSSTKIYFAWGGVEQTVADWKAWLAEQYANGTPVEIVYQLAEPITIQLTPQEILALSGINTLRSDTGNTQVTGRADPTAVLEKITNAIVALGGNI